MAPFTNNDFRRVQRRVADALTRHRNAIGVVRGFVLEEGGNPHARTLLGLEADRLLAAGLRDLERLVDVLWDESNLEDLEQAASELRAAIRRRRLVAKLGATNGRTPEEAASFEAAAERLRG